MTISSANTPPQRTFAPSTKSRLLQCAAASAAAWALLPTAAHAAIPPECDEQIAPNIITCVVPEPDQVEQVDVTQDNTTIVIGSTDTPTVLNTFAGDGIVLNGDGAQTIVVNEGSIVNAENGDGISISGDALVSIFSGADSAIAGGGSDGIQILVIGANAGINLNLQGSVSGLAAGISAQAVGDGEINIVTADVSGGQGIGIFANNAGDGGLSIDTSAGDVTGGSFGIRAENQGPGSLMIDTSMVSGGSENAIFASNINDGSLIINSSGAVSSGGTAIVATNSGSGDISITAADVVSTSGEGINAINSIASNDLLIDTSAGVVSSELTAISARNEGTGDTRITTGSLSTQQGSGVDVTNEATARSLSVDTTAGAIERAATGIEVINLGSGSTTIRAGDIKAGVGIIANTSGTFTTIDTTAGSVIAFNEAIIVNHGGSGALVIETGDVEGPFTLVDAIRANNLSGSETAINTVAGSVLGGQSGINLSHNGGGGVSITTANVTGTGAGGIVVFGTSGTDVAIDSTAGTVSGGTAGIFVDHDGSGSVGVTSGDVIGNGTVGIFADVSDAGTGLSIDSSAGSVFAAEAGIVGLHAGTGMLSITSGDVTSFNNVAIVADAGASVGGVVIDGSAGTVSGELGAILADNEGIGLTSITTSDVNSAAGVGIMASGGATSTNLIIDTTDGSVSAAATGINAIHNGTGTAQIRTADVSGTSGDGIFVATGAQSSSLDIDTTAGNVSGGENGLFVQHSGTGIVSVSTGSVTGVNETGVAIFSLASDINLDTVGGVITGQNFGINLLNQDAGQIDVVTGDVLSAAGIGIFAENNGTSLTIDSRGGIVTGATNGIEAINNGSSSVSIATGDVIGNDSIGIFVENNGLLAFIDTTAGTVSGSNEAIVARNNSGSLTVLTGDLNGMASAGLIATNNAGSSFLTIDTSAGSVNAAGAGISANNQGSGEVSVISSDVTSQNNLGIGVQNSAAGTGVEIDSSAGSINSNFAGVSVINNGTGGVVVRTGDVTSNGGSGIRARNNAGSGDIGIDTTAGAVVAADDGIFADQNGTGAVTITSGDVSAVSQGIWVRSDSDQVTITNNGLIEAGEFAVLVSAAQPGTTTINNNGTLNGAIDLSQMDDTLSNNGLFNATRDSFFDEGDDIFVNNGRLQIVGNVAFNDLELLNNSGQLSLADGNLGDSLTLTGDYFGSGGRLELDVDLGEANISDMLIVAGAATGTTEIALSTLGQFANFGNSIVLVDAGDGTSADAFALAGGNQVNQGFLVFGLSFDAANNDFLLESALGSAAFQPLKIGEGALALWYNSADAWRSHVDSRRNAASDERAPIWLQFNGSVSDRDDRFQSGSGVLAQDIALDYRQDFFGFQTGVEFGALPHENGAYFGGTVGYQSSDLNFNGLADGVRYESFNLGAYAGYQSGNFFAQGLVKYDFINADIEGQSAGYEAESNGRALGFRGEAGLRWSKGSFFLEPSASLEYQAVDLDDFTALGADFDLDNVEGLRGTVGLRLGGQNSLKNGSTLTYYASAHAVHEFDGEGEVAISAPLASQTLLNNPIDTFARIDLGINIATQGGVTGFIEGNADLSSDYSSFGGRAGLRIGF